MITIDGLLTFSTHAPQRNLQQFSHSRNLQELLIALVAEKSGPLHSLSLNFLKRKRERGYVCHRSFPLIVYLHGKVVFRDRTSFISTKMHTTPKELTLQYITCVFDERDTDAHDGQWRNFFWLLKYRICVNAVCVSSITVYISEGKEWL